MHRHRLRIWPLRSAHRPPKNRLCRRSLRYTSQYVIAMQIKNYSISMIPCKTCYQAYHGHDEILQLLLPLFPNTNIKEDSGKTPLDLASYKGHKQCIVLLLRFGASVAVQVRIWIFRLVSVMLTRSINVIIVSRTPSRNARPCIALLRQVTRIAWLFFCRTWMIPMW